MHKNSVLMVTLVLGSFVAVGRSQERDAPTISLRKGYTLSKKLARISDDTLPLRLKMEMLQEEVLAGENFPIRFTITNRNRTALRVSAAGGYRPSLYAGLANEELALFVEQSLELQVGGGAILLAPDESVTMTRTVYPYSDPVSAMLYAERGYTLRLRGAGMVEAAAIEESGCPMVMCKWVSDEIEVSVRAPTVHEQEAYQAILGWNEAQPQLYQAIFDRNRARGVHDLVSHEEWTLARVGFYGKFLNEYGDTPYANQLRVLLLEELAQLPRQKSGKNGEPLPQFLPLYVKTVSELLDAGVPYASKVNCGVLETLGMGGRWDMVATALEKLLGMSPSERMLDRTFATVAREYGEILSPKAREYIGEAAKSMEQSVLACIARCASWEGFRAVPFDRRAFAFLSEMRQWRLLELTARQTLQAARLGQDCGGQARFGQPGVKDGTIAAAEEALNMARRERGKRP